MSNLIEQSFEQEQQPDIVDDENFEKDDLVTFQHDSKTINFFYSQLTKYSKHIRESYLFSDASNRLPEEIQQFQEESQLLSESVDYFFQLSQQNYNINEDTILTYSQCIDLLKISKHLEVRKLSSKINQYIRAHKVDVDFIVQMIEYDMQTRNERENQEIKISVEIERLLSSKINECLSNDKFRELPIQIIFRIVKQSSPKAIDSNKLFDIIMKSMNKFCVLLQFLDLQKLSDGRLEELCEMHSKSDENTKQYFDYLKCNLSLIYEMNNRKKDLHEMNVEQRNKLNDLESKFSSLQNQFNDSEKVNAQLQKKFNDSEKANAQLQSQFDDSKRLISEQQNKMNELEALLQNQFNEQLQKQLNYSKSLEGQISQMQKQLDEIFLIKGKVVASEKGLLINAEINLKTKGPTLDTSKSKVIVSTSDAKCIGSEAYEKGEPITSLHMKTSFFCKPGAYYVRCIVFNSEGKSNEIVSDSVTTSGNCLKFDFNSDRQPEKVTLPQGQYKLEVWGAKGGDSNGSGWTNRSNGQTVQGGLGGYSRGILNLKKKETVYVLVGEKGSQPNSSDGSTANGGFPDGGGAKAGHYSSYTTVPGTGGGSTSIRIGSNTNYTRVIVAGGGGGASGSSEYVDPGGFGGGLNGGNCSYMGSIKDQGAGTQTGSTRGLGECDDRHGDPGVFGSGATGKYCQSRDSGGGGGGGWYGGGSGGYGSSRWCSSGGGGSGWIFTEKSMAAFRSGDSSNSSKFTLDSSYYLSDAVCIGDNEEFPRPDGNGNERGHNGNGYAKITPL